MGNKYAISIDITGHERSHLNEEEVDDYVRHQMASAIAQELAKHLTVEVEKIPDAVPGYPSRGYVPIGEKHTMTAYVFTEDELLDYLDTVKRKVLRELAEDIALKNLPLTNPN